MVLVSLLVDWLTSFTKAVSRLHVDGTSSFASRGTCVCFISPVIQKCGTTQCQERGDEFRSTFLKIDNSHKFRGGRVSFFIERADLIDGLLNGGVRHCLLQIGYFVCLVAGNWRRRFVSFLSRWSPQSNFRRLTRVCTRQARSFDHIRCQRTQCPLDTTDHFFHIPMVHPRHHHRHLDLQLQHKQPYLGGDKQVQIALEELHYNCHDPRVERGSLSGPRNVQTSRIFVPIL